MRAWRQSSAPSSSSSELLSPSFSFAAPWSASLSQQSSVVCLKEMNSLNKTTNPNGWLEVMSLHSTSTKARSAENGGNKTCSLCCCWNLSKHHHLLAMKWICTFRKRWATLDCKMEYNGPIHVLCERWCHHSCTSIFSNRCNISPCLLIWEYLDFCPDKSLKLQ